MSTLSSIARGHGISAPSAAGVSDKLRLSELESLAAEAGLPGGLQVRYI